MLNSPSDEEVGDGYANVRNDAGINKSDAETEAPAKRRRTENLQLKGEIFCPSESFDLGSNENIADLLAQTASLTKSSDNLLCGFVSGNLTPSADGDDGWDCDSGHGAVDGDSSIASPGSGSG